MCDVTCYRPAHSPLLSTRSFPPAEVGNQLVAANLGWPAVFGLLNVAYYALHYMFASQVGPWPFCLGLFL